MGNKGIDAILVGLNDGNLGYRVLIRGTNSIKVSNNIRFPRESPLRHSTAQSPSDGGATDNGPESASRNSNEVDSLNDAEQGGAPDNEEEAGAEESSNNEVQVEPEPSDDSAA